MKIIPVPCGFDNYSYILIDSGTASAAVIDPSEGYPVLQQLEMAGVSLEMVLCTHHHQDHIDGLGLLREEKPDLAVYCHFSDKQRIRGANLYVEHNSELNLGQLPGRVIHTPGHTSGSVCYLFEDALFSGDTLFGAGCGRLFEGTAEQMYLSLTQQLGQLDDSTRVYFGHEYTAKNLEFAVGVEPENGKIEERLQGLGATSTPSTMGLERETNPFLRCSSDDIRQAMAARGVGQVQSDVALFALLRQLRNDF